MNVKEEMTNYFLIFLCLLLCCVAGESQQPQSANGIDVNGKYYSVEWNTVMVESTYRISAPSSTIPGKDTVGTGFVMGIPIIAADGNNSAARPILITAKHVLTGTRGDFAILDMRVYENGAWNESKIPLRIRKNGVPLWVEHPIADVAILDLQDARINSHLIEPLVPTDWLAPDKLLKDYQIHPGDEVVCLGFPENLSSQFGFPIARTARIASFPILPTVSSRPLYLDFPVYGGNSGGPAYIPETSSRGNTLGPTLSHLFVIGLVIEKQYASPQDQVAVSQDGTDANKVPLEDMHLAILEPASIIRETVNLMPGVSEGTIHSAPAK